MYTKRPEFVVNMDYCCHYNNMIRLLSIVESCISQPRVLELINLYYRKSQMIMRKSILWLFRVVSSFRLVFIRNLPSAKALITFC